jgi:hypothetical protein
MISAIFVSTILFASACIPAAGFVLDQIRLAKGRKFLRARAASGNPFRTDQGFLESFTESELTPLQAAPARWVDKSLPDIRSQVVSQDHARIYWRIAVDKLESGDLKAELAALCGSVALGITATSTLTHFISSGMAFAGYGYFYLVASGVLVVIVSLGVMWKVSSRRRWEEAIEVYRKTGWPDYAPTPPRRMKRFVWPHR